MTYAFSDVGTAFVLKYVSGITDSDQIDQNTWIRMAQRVVKHDS